MIWQPRLEAKDRPLLNVFLSLSPSHPIPLQVYDGFAGYLLNFYVASLNFAGSCGELIIIYVNWIRSYLYEVDDLCSISLSELYFFYFYLLFFCNFYVQFEFFFHTVCLVQFVLVLADEFIDVHGGAEEVDGAIDVDRGIVLEVCDGTWEL